MQLTIAVITMNRADQLKEALESCLACALPKETEFVIIDNASTDNTEQTVAALLKNCSYFYYYEKLQTNLGVGGGRNYAFSKATGQYVYVLDDDAVIDIEKNPDFFKKAIAILDANPRIATLTTQIYDFAWQANRLTTQRKPIAQGIYSCKMFCGGSHFLRKTFFKNAPYLPNKYGFEEILPSLKVVDAGNLNAFVPSLLVIHKPKINKWEKSNKENLALFINECAVPYAIKKMMYPRLCLPILWLAYRVRIRKHLRHYSGAAKKCHQVAKETTHNYKINYRIRWKTLLQLQKDFGFSIF